MTSMDVQIRTAAKKYLDEGKVSCVIGYERDSRGRVRPAFIEKAESVRKRYAVSLRSKGLHHSPS